MNWIRIALVVVFSGAGVAQAQTFRANLIDSNGKWYGTRQIRDLSLCGTRVGPVAIQEGGEKGDENHQHNSAASSNSLFFECTSRFEALRIPTTAWAGSEVRTLIHQGDVTNRIDLTIVSDGYTAAEKDKFFADAQRVADDLFGADTFKTYLALFNVHAVFVPSVDSGIGDGRPKNTALKLYRDSRLRQAVMCADEFSAARAAQLAPDADYRILLGNDTFYGGLGGAFAITTSAPLNITTVLRHELGHNFARVGEEYDGGQVYDGANYSSSANVPWPQWVENSTTPNETTYEAKLLMFEAPWQNLNGRNWEAQVTFPTNADRMFVDFNTLGSDTPNDIQVLVDGNIIPYTGEFNYDRNFYGITLTVTPGTHRIQVREAVNDRNNVLSKIGVYALPPNYPVNDGRVGAFLTYDESDSPVGYRPTDRTCLMRDMKSKHFCSVCTENMWKNFLREVSLIDGVSLQGAFVQLTTLPVGDARLEISWRDPRGQTRSSLAGLKQWAPVAADKGTWTVSVRFKSPEIRMNDQSWAQHSKTFVVR